MISDNLSGIFNCDLIGEKFIEFSDNQLLSQDIYPHYFSILISEKIDTSPVCLHNCPILSGSVCFAMLSASHQVQRQLIG